MRRGIPGRGHRKNNFYVSAGLRSYIAGLLQDPEEQEKLIKALSEGKSREQAMIVLRRQGPVMAFPKAAAEHWQPDFVWRAADYFRPAQHPEHEKGSYYCLDLSSTFTASLMLAIRTPVHTVLDLCASPGGKSIFAHAAFQPDLLICNETIFKRWTTLLANLQRCQVTESAISKADPSVWARKCPGLFDLVIVDAPCSGQSLPAKGEEAPGAFSSAMIDMNVSRQRRIVANGVQCLAPGGHLLYLTCTFSRDENEKVVAWVLKEFPNLVPVGRDELSAFQSRFAETPCYRLYPHQGMGAGGFCAMFRNTDTGEANYVPIEEMPLGWTYRKGFVGKAAAPKVPAAKTAPKVKR